MTTATETPAPRVDNNLLQHDNKVFLKFVTISSPDTLARFNNDLNVMTAQARRILELNQRIQTSLTTGEKDAISKLRDGELADFNQKDDIFAKVYGFKVDSVAIRPHFIQNTAIQLMTPVTDEQVAELRKNADFKEADIQARGNAKMVVLSKVTGDHIPVLNNSIEVIQVQQNTILQLRAAEQAATDEAAKARIKEELAKATDVLTKNAEFMGKTYGVVTNNLVFDVLEAHFWVALTPDELKAYVAQNHGTAAQALAEASDAPKLDVKKDKKSS